MNAKLFLVAYVLYAEVLRENTYLSRTIEVQEEGLEGYTDYKKKVRFKVIPFIW